jgi:hypothetical protein
MTALEVSRWFDRPERRHDGFHLGGPLGVKKPLILEYGQELVALKRLVKNSK